MLSVIVEFVVNSDEEIVALSKSVMRGFIEEHSEKEERFDDNYELNVFLSKVGDMSKWNEEAIKHVDPLRFSAHSDRFGNSETVTINRKELTVEVRYNTW